MKVELQELQIVSKEVSQRRPVVPVDNITGILDDTLKQLLPEGRQYSTVNVLTSSYDNDCQVQTITSKLQILDTVICDIVERSKNMIKRILTLNKKIILLSHKICAEVAEHLNPSDRLEDLYPKYFDSVEREQLQAMSLEFAPKTMTKDKKKSVFQFGLVRQSSLTKRQGKLSMFNSYKPGQLNGLSLRLTSNNQADSENSVDQDQEQNIKKMIFEELSPMDKVIFRGAMKNVVWLNKECASWLFSRT